MCWILYKSVELEEMYCTTQNMSSSTSPNSGHSETHPSHSMTQGHLKSKSQIQSSTSHFNQFRLPSTLFSDPVDDNLSEMESFDTDDLYGSDSDTKIIGKEAPLFDPPSSDLSSSVSDTSVWPLLLGSTACAHTQARLLMFLRESV